MSRIAVSDSIMISINSPQQLPNQSCNLNPVSTGMLEARTPHVGATQQRDVVRVMPGMKHGDEFFRNVSEGVRCDAIAAARVP